MHVPSKNRQLVKAMPLQQFASPNLSVRQQVRAGPDALPGAVAVEDEQGRMLSLATLAAEVSPI
jgi:hypothetical protein